MTEKTRPLNSIRELTGIVKQNRDFGNLNLQKSKMQALFALLLCFVYGPGGGDCNGSNFTRA